MKVYKGSRLCEWAPVRDWTINLLGVVPFGGLVVMLRWSRPGVFLAIVLSAVQQFAHGDMNVDGVIDLADLLLILQAVLQ